MNQIKKRIAYLQGLAEGLSLDKETKEGKMFAAVLSVLEEMAETIDQLSENQDDLEKYIEAVDEDLADIEDEIFGDEDDEDQEDEYDDDDEEGYIEVECPKCHDIVRFEPSILADEDVIEITCPNCDEVVYVNDGEGTAEEEKD